MYERLYKLNEVKKFFENEINVINEEQIETLYNKISNPYLRVNDDDKQWVAYVTQDSENETVEKAIKEILGISEEIWLSSYQRKVKEAIKIVGNVMIEKNIHNKPRIPFYILVLDEII